MADLIRDHRFYPVRENGRELLERCYTCARPINEHESNGWQVTHPYSYEWGCHCQPCCRERDARSAKKKGAN